MVSELQSIWYSWLEMEIMSIAWKYNYADSVTFGGRNAEVLV